MRAGLVYQGTETSPVKGYTNNNFVLVGGHWKQLEGMLGVFLSRSGAMDLVSIIRPGFARHFVVDGKIRMLGGDSCLEHRGS